MHIIHTILLSLLLLFSLLGCGEDIETTTPNTEDTVQSAQDIFTAGDDQNVLAGHDVILSASILDKEKTFKQVIWKEDGQILGDKNTLQTSTLSTGTHTITLEMVDTAGKTYQDTITVNIKEPSQDNTQPQAFDFEITVDEDTTSKATSFLGRDRDGDSLRYLLLTNPKHGKLSGSYARLKYTPEANYFGTDSFTYKTNDGIIDSEIATVSIMIKSVNDTPVAQDQNITLKEDSNTPIILTAYDVDDTRLTYTHTNPQNGTFTNGIYTPKDNYFGEDSFTFLANDGESNSKEATVHIMITAVDDMLQVTTPSPQDANLSINEGTISGQIIATDIDAESITYTLQNSLLGFDINDSGHYTYTPSVNDYVGLRTGEKKILHIPIMINDTKTTLKVTIIGQNEAPHAIISSLNTVMQNVLITFNAHASYDEDINDTMTYLWKEDTIPVSSDLELNTSFSTLGEHNITLTVTDGSNASHSTSKTIMIIDGHPHMDLRAFPSNIYEGESFSSQGLIPLSGGAETFTYTPANNIIGFAQKEDGSFAFTSQNTLYQKLKKDEKLPITIPFKVTGSNGLSDEQNLSFTITGTNDTPIARDDTNTTNEDTNITFNILTNDSDVDNNHTLTLSSVRTNKGSVSFSADGNVTFSPQGAFDSLTLDTFEDIELSYIIQDEYNATATAKIQLHITGVDDAIVIQPLHISKIDLENDTQLSGILKAYDVDSTFTFSDNNASNGFTIDLKTGAFTFTPNTQYSALKAGEEQILHIPIMIGNKEHILSFTIIGKNEAPQGVADSATLQEDNFLEIDVLQNDTDTDHDTLTIDSFTQPTLGTVKVQNNKILYTPKKDISGSDSFTYIPKDNDTIGTNTTVNVTISPVNDAPVFTSTAPTRAIEGQSYTYVIQTKDNDSNETLSVLTKPEWLTLNGNILSGTVPVGQTAIYPINLVVSDNNLSNTQNFTISVTNVNFAPIFTSSPIMIDTDEDNSSITGIITANDNDTNDILTFTTDTNLSGFSLDTNGTYNLDLNSDFYQALAEAENFTSTVTIKVSDTAGTFVEQNLSVFIHGRNDAPSYETFNTTTSENENKTFEVLSHISDKDHAHQLTLTQATASSGTITVHENNHTLTFSPLGEFDYLKIAQHEVVNISYTVSDEHNATVDANMTIRVNGQNDAPILATQSSITIDEDTPKSADINASDLEGNTLTYDSNSSLLTFNTNGTYIIKTDNSFEHLAEGTQMQTLIMISVSDGITTSTQELNVTINGKNDTPIANPDEYNVTQNEAIDMSVLSNDRDDDNDTLSIETINVNGLTVNRSGQNISFQAGHAYDALKEGETEDVTFSYTITDQHELESTSANVLVHVSGKNDAPTAHITGAHDIQEGETLTLQAISQTIDANTSIQSHTWILDGVTQSTQDDVITLQPSEGSHSLQLQVTDNRNLTSTTSSVTIIVTKQNSRFVEEQTINTYTNGEISRIELGDLDKDGDLDILVNARDKQVLWYENRGDNTYTPHSIANNVSSNTVHIADINQDGFSDILYAGNSLTICTNKKDKTFNCKQTIHSGIMAYDDIRSISVNDIDNDYDMDILTTAYNESTVNIFTNEGNGTFSYSSEFSRNIEGSASGGSLSKAISIDSNQNHDLIVAGEDGEIHFHTYNADGSFTKTASLTADTPSSVSFAMLDSDNEADIIGATKKGELFWYSKTQNNKYTIENLSYAIPYASGVDIDGDGYIDILTNTNASDGAIMWFKNDGEIDPTFTKQAIATKPNVTITQAGDLDNDGDIDIVSADKDGKLYIYTNNTPIQTRIIAPVYKGDFTRSNEGIVTDHDTGLMWQDTELKQADAPKYGIEDSYDNQQGGCENLSLGNFTDWRLPNRDELYFLAKKELTEQELPRVDSTFLHTGVTQNILGGTYSAYWTSNPNRYIDFRKLSETLERPDFTGEKFARCVRGKPTTYTFIKEDASELIRDKIHNLMWHESDITANWDDAVSYCQESEEGEFTDWELPNINQLYTITTTKNAHPAFEQATDERTYWWSSTQEAGGVYAMNFKNGLSIVGSKSSTIQVRCVREIP